MKSANPSQPTLEVARPAEQALAQRPSAPAPATFDIEGMFKYALEKSAGPEAMSTLMNIRRELNAEASKKAFYEAFSAFQAECPVIVKGRAVPTKSGETAYKFAPIEKVEEVIRPIERKHGFTHTFDTDVSSAIGFVIAKCIVNHNAGFTRESTIKLPLGSQTQIMSNTQVYASAMTFANRRALANVYGLVLAGEDNDGGTRPKPAGPTQAAPKAPEDGRALAKRLWTLLLPVVSAGEGWDKAKWDGHNQWLRDAKIITKPETCAEKLPAVDIQEIIEKAELVLSDM